MTNFDQRNQRVEEQYNAGHDIIVNRPVLPPSKEDVQHKKNRDKMLERVRSRWITNFLEKSLQGTTSLLLEYKDQSDAVVKPWSSEVQELDQFTQSQQAYTSISNAYDAADTALLILGGPGSGKTTLLLELTRDLLDRATSDDEVGIPVVFNLSSWAVKRQSIIDWLIEELNVKYQVPHKLGQWWVDNDQILPLLDGLDEVAVTHRAACMEAINAYRREHGLVPIVVCCRQSEYLTQAKRLLLRNAVVIQPLTAQMIDEYLSTVGDKMETVRIAIHDDPTLQELTATPLMLNVLTLAYQGKPDSDLLKVNNPATWQHHVFTAYVQYMLQRRGVSTQYTPKQTMHWLTWLAQQLVDHSQSEFYIERMQPTWLPTRWRYQLSYDVLMRLGIGLFCGLFGVLFFFIFFKLLSLSSAEVILAGLFFGLFAGQISHVDAEIKPAEIVVWSWRNMWRGLIRLNTLRNALLVGACAGLFDEGFSRLLFKATTWPTTALVVILLSGLFFGLIELPTADAPLVGLEKPNTTKLSRGKWRFSWNNMLIGLIFGVASGVLAGLLFGLVSGVLFTLFSGELGTFLYTLRNMFFIGVLAGLVSGMCFGLAYRVEKSSGFVKTTFKLWSKTWRRLASLEAVRSGLLYGMLFGLIVGILFGPIYGINFGFLFWIFSGIVFGLLNKLIGGLSSKMLDERNLAKPRQGIRRSARNSLVVGLIFGLVGGLIFGLVGGLFVGFLEGLVAVLIGIVFFGVLGILTSGLTIGLLNGGIACIQHFVLCFLLWLSGFIPWNYPRFLDYAVERIFLRKIGGGYIFVHRMLLEYFATLQTPYVYQQEVMIVRKSNEMRRFLALPLILTRVLLIIVILVLTSALLRTSFVSLYPPAGWSLTLEDTLKNEYHWEERTYSPVGGICGFVKEGYQISVSKTTTYFHCNIENSDFANFAFETQMTIVKGDEGGIVFRCNANSGTCYHFRISQEGLYVLRIYKNSDFSIVLASGPSASIHKGFNQSNLVAILAQGNTFNLYINHQLITTVIDKSNTLSHGQLGISAIAIKKATQVLFSNAKVWTSKLNASSTLSLSSMHSYPPPQWDNIFSDQLKNEYHWPNQKLNALGAGCEFVVKGYQVSTAKRSNDYNCFVQDTDFNDFAFEVQMSIVKGDFGGIVFRGDSHTQHFYYCWINKEGFYQVGFYKNFSSGTVQASGTIAAIHRGFNQPNLIAVVVQGNTFNLYINHQWISNIKGGNNISRHGEIGVSAVNITNATEVLYSNARVWTS